MSKLIANLIKETLHQTSNEATRAEIIEYLSGTRSNQHELLKQYQKLEKEN